MQDYPLRALVDPLRLMKLSNFVPIGEMTELVASVFFEEFLQGLEISYEYYVTKYLMLRNLPVSLPPLSEGSPKHPAALEDNDEQPGENDPTSEGDFGGFDFGGAKLLPPSHLHGTPPIVPYAYAAGLIPLSLTVYLQGHYTIFFLSR